MSKIIHTVEYPYMTRSTRRIIITLADDRLLAQVQIITPGWDDMPGGATLEEIDAALSEAKAKLAGDPVHAQIVCPSCDGKGTTTGLYCGPHGCRNHTGKCTRCDGLGVIGEDGFNLMLAGERIRKARIARGVTQRFEASRLGMTVIEYSDLEQGRVRSK